MIILAQAQVAAHNPPRGIQVILKSTGQQFSFPVVMLQDYVDAARASQRPLPVIGTWGKVLFSYDDPKNGVWLGSYAPSLMDAFTLSQASGIAATDPFIDYEAHFSGDMQLLDGLGNQTHQWADGSYILAASGNALPTVYRHTVDQNNAQQTVAYSWADRIPAPPPPFYYIFQHQTGTVFTTDPSGNVSVSGSSGYVSGGVSGIPASLTIKFGGSTGIFDASGNVTVSGAVGAVMTITFGGTVLTIDASGKTTLALPANEEFVITQGGASPTDRLVLNSKFVTAFNAHTHSGVQTGGGNTGTVTSPLTSASVPSTIIDISN